MTTQVLIRPLSVIMGDNNNDNTSTSTNLPVVVNSPPSTVGILEVDGDSGVFVPPLSTNAASTKTTAVAEEQDISVDSSSRLTMSAEAVTVDNRPAVGTEATSSKVNALVQSLSTSGPSGDSFCPTITSLGGVGKETGIVSHLRRSSSTGSSRQDIETTLKARGSTEMASLNIFGNSSLSNAFAGSMSASPMIHPSSFGLNFGNNVNNNNNPDNNNNNNNMAALATAAAGFPLTAVLMNQLASGISSNNNGGIMLHPHILMAAGLGMGNFGNFSVLAAAGGKPGSVLDPRFGSALFGGGSAAASAVAATPQTMKHKPLTLYMDCDTESLSEYQCLIRQQIELFAADKSEASSSVQGRNKQIVEGQVGIRCRHCAAVPPRQRQKGSMYFPTKLDRIYQAAQNLSTFHLCDNCTHVPENVRKKILLLRERKSPAGGGKRYWGEGVRCLGVTEDQNGLRFR